MKAATAIRRGVRICVDTERRLANAEKETLEGILEAYIKLLLLSGVAAAAATFLWQLLKAAFYDVVRGVTVDYLNLANYTFSVSAGTFFFYLFAGTFGLGILSLLLSPFFRMKYTRLVKILCDATMPVLLFGWPTPNLAWALFVWSLVIFIVGVRSK